MTQTLSASNARVALANGQTSRPPEAGGRFPLAKILMKSARSPRGTLGSKRHHPMELLAREEYTPDRSGVSLLGLARRVRDAILPQVPR